MLMFRPVSYFTNAADTVYFYHKRYDQEKCRRIIFLKSKQCSRNEDKMQDQTTIAAITDNAVHSTT